MSKKNTHRKLLKKFLFKENFLEFFVYRKFLRNFYLFKIFKEIHKEILKNIENLVFL